MSLSSLEQGSILLLQQIFLERLWAAGTGHRTGNTAENPDTVPALEKPPPRKGRDGKRKVSEPSRSDSDTFQGKKEDRGAVTLGRNWGVWVMERGSEEM